MSAQTLTTLASFTGTKRELPQSSLVQGRDGNFYGTTSMGGANEAGTVFKITPGGQLTTMYSFCSQAGCTDGAKPVAPLFQASDGNFYGTTTVNGIDNGGTIFKITPAGTLATLYSFCSQPGCADGEEPIAGLVQASDGNFYGSTLLGGDLLSGGGTIFKITPGGTLTTLHTFCLYYGCHDGAEPEGGMIQGPDGNLYGTTSQYGATTGGTIFKISLTGVMTTLYNFCANGGCTDGSVPFAGVIQASDGNFYGTTTGGGANQAGTIFELTTDGSLSNYNFCPEHGCLDGQGPYGGVIQAFDGNFYGTTYTSGANNAGSIFKATPDGVLTTLWSFCAQPGCADGQGPEAGLIQATDGNLYGTTNLGGANNVGVVFKLALASTTSPPAINPSSGVVSGASFQAGITSDSWVTILGTNLSSKTDTWANAIVNGNLPTSLDGVSVIVGGKPAYISFLSPTQINALAPNVATGTVAVTVTNSSGTSTSINVVVQTAQPAFFAWGNYAVATRQDYSVAVKNGTFPTLTTIPAKPGEVVTLWGTGFGPTNPSAPAGAVVPSNTQYNTANTVVVTVGGNSAIVYGAALAPGFAGLYQVAIQIPASLSNGDYPVIATVAGAQSPSTVLITVQN